MTRHTLSAGIGLAALAGAGLLALPSAMSAMPSAESATVGHLEAIPDCAQPGPYQLPQGGDPVELDPADFTTRINNPWWPMKPGTTWHYVERSAGEYGTVTTKVTGRTKVLGGVRAREVHDVARENGQVIEDTLDWYAQDSSGSIWYLGELSKQFEHGALVGTAGSWKYGVDGGQAGVIIPANPEVGCSYREEYHAPDARDQARVLATSEGLQGPTGFYKQALHTANFSPAEPRALENKFYGRGVGPVLELDLSPQLGSSVLVRVTR